MILERSGSVPFLDLLNDDTRTGDYEDMGIRTDGGGAVIRTDGGGGIIRNDDGGGIVRNDGGGGAMRTGWRQRRESSPYSRSPSPSPRSSRSSSPRQVLLNHRTGHRSVKLDTQYILSNVAM